MATHAEFTVLRPPPEPDLESQQQRAFFRTNPRAGQLLVDEIFEFLRTLAASGSARLFVEQDVRKALDLADRVYVLNKGRIQFAGEAAELDADLLAESYLGAAATA